MARVFVSHASKAAQHLSRRLLPVPAEQGMDHQLLTSVQQADLTLDPDAGRIQLITALHRVDVAQCGRRFAQYTGIATGIAAVVLIVVNLLFLPPPNAAFTSHPATQPDPMAPGASPGQFALVPR